MDYRYFDIPSIGIDGKLIPLWEFDCEIGEYSNVPEYSHKTCYGTYYDSHIVICKYDMVTKKTFRSDVVSLDYKPKFDIGKTCLIEMPNLDMKQVKVKEIIRGRCDVDKVTTKNQILSYCNRCVPSDAVDGLSELQNYNFMVYNPKYIMEDGTECEWEYKLHNIYEG